MSRLAFDEHTNQAESCGLSLETSLSETTTVTHQSISFGKASFFSLDQSQIALLYIPQSSKIANREATLPKPILIRVRVLWAKNSAGANTAHNLCEGGRLCKVQPTCSVTLPLGNTSRGSSRISLHHAASICQKREAGTGEAEATDVPSSKDTQEIPGARAPKDLTVQRGTRRALPPNNKMTLTILTMKTQKMTEGAMKQLSPA